MLSSRRTMALAALPVVVLAQCAPQCAPAPGPPTVAVSSVVVPGVADGPVAQMTRDGRFVVLVGAEQNVRVDLADPASTVPLPPSGLLTADGAVVAHVVDRRTVTLRRVGSGVVVSAVDLPTGWAGDVTSVSDDGRRVLVEAWSESFGETVFQVDTGSGRITRVDAALGVNWPDRVATGARISGDGSTTVFEYRTGPLDCEGCQQLWAARPGRALQLVNMTAAVGTPSTGGSRVEDVSANGRFVLFSSTSPDLLGSTGSGAVRLYVRDLDARTTVELPVEYDDFVQQAAISDDGQRVAFATDVDATALFDRPSGVTVSLALPDGAPTYAPPSEIELSGDGRRIVTSPRPHAGPAATPDAVLLVADVVPT